MKTHFKCAAMLIGLLALTGCPRLHTTDIVAKKLVTVELGKSEVVEFSDVKVVKQYSDLLITGVITRKPGVKGVIPGHIVITIKSGETGAEEARFSTLWKPSSIPMTGKRQSTFIVRYGTVPEEGSILKIAYDKSDTDLSSEPLSSGGTDSDSNAPAKDDKAGPTTNPTGIPTRQW